MRYFKETIKWLNMEKLYEERTSFRFKDEEHHVHHNFDEKAETLRYSVEERDENGAIYLEEYTLSFFEYYFSEVIKRARIDLAVIDTDYRHYNEKISSDIQLSVDRLALEFRKSGVDNIVPKLKPALIKLFARCTQLFGITAPKLTIETRGNPEYKAKRISDAIFSEMVNYANDLLDQDKETYQPQNNRKTSGMINKKIEAEYDFKYDEKRIGDNFRSRTRFDGKYFRIK